MLHPFRICTQMKTLKIFPKSPPKINICQLRTWWKNSTMNNKKNLSFNIKIWDFSNLLTFRDIFSWKTCLFLWTFFDFAQIVTGKKLPELWKLHSTSPDDHFGKNKHWKKLKTFAEKKAKNFRTLSNEFLAEFSKLHSTCPEKSFVEKNSENLYFSRSLREKFSDFGR